MKELSLSESELKDLWFMLYSLLTNLWTTGEIESDFQMVKGSLSEIEQRIHRIRMLEESEAKEET